ncbi:uncharacterized protein L3040_008792 [Drepanopeziza brunnea f. sp. 'multigermtubi']|nr:hypothetical protein L3040_008792 [Drepanopeziza brunnea f. sp. 'multigermtubi']
MIYFDVDDVGFNGRSWGGGGSEDKGGRGGFGMGLARGSELVNDKAEETGFGVENEVEDAGFEIGASGLDIEGWGGVGMGSAGADASGWGIEGWGGEGWNGSADTNATSIIIEPGFNGNASRSNIELGFNGISFAGTNFTGPNAEWRGWNGSADTNASRSDVKRWNDMGMNIVASNIELGFDGMSFAGTNATGPNAE